MKKLFVGLLCAVFVFGCAATTLAPAPCEPQILKEYEDHVGNLILMIDENCDNRCDFAALLQFAGVDEAGESLYIPVMEVSCGKAEWIWQEYKKDLDNNSASF